VENALMSADRRIMNLITEYPIHVLAMYLTPKYKKITISKHYTSEKIQIIAIKLAKKWSYSLNDAKTLKSQLTYYDEHVLNSNEWLLNASDYWNGVQTNNFDILKKFALEVLALTPHSGAIEQLFSIMAYKKKTNQGRMEKDTLTAMTKVTVGLNAINKKKEPIGKKKDDKFQNCDIESNLEEEVSGSSDVDDLSHFLNVEMLEGETYQNEQDFCNSSQYRSVYQIENYFDLAMIQSIQKKFTEENENDTINVDGETEEYDWDVSQLVNVDDL